MEMGKLIYDVGMHRGEDTEFYLKLGHRVIGIEANPNLIEFIYNKFNREIKSGQLVVIDKAISNRHGRVKFAINEFSVFGSLANEFEQRNIKLGLKNQYIEVESVTFESVYREWGVPYYLKIDIEGSDRFCLEDLLKFSERPKYLSIESVASAPNCGIHDVINELTLIKNLGYNAFQYINQATIPNSLLDNSSEGNLKHYVFPQDSSGPFGKDLPAAWKSARKAIIDGMRIRILEDFCGHNGRMYGKFGTWRLRDLRTRITGNQDHWYDLHAARAM
jgi:FkbM family methyltransferase